MRIAKPPTELHGGKIIITAGGDLAKGKGLDNSFKNIRCL